MESPFKIIDGIRTANIEDTQKFAKSKDELVKRVVDAYNSDPKNKDRLAIRNRSRKPRDPDEQRVLDSFNLK